MYNDRNIQLSMKIRRFFQNYFFHLSGTVLLFGFLIIAVSAVKIPQLLRPRAAPEIQPKNVRVTNITENSFTVSWLTETKVTAAIKYGVTTDAMDQTALEDNGGGLYSLHYITVRPSKPQKTYYFIIQSGDRRFDDSSRPFSVNTAPVLATPPPPQSIYGSILSDSDEKSPPERIIVFVDIPEASPLSGLANPQSGNWALSISTARTRDLNQYIQVDDSTVLTIYAEAGSAGSAAATVKLGQAAPVPSMGLGQTYQFEKLSTAAESKTSAELELTAAVTETGVAPGLVPPEIKLSVDNLSEGQTLTDSTPTFAGSAPPNSTISISVKSKLIAADIKVGANGQWSWTPPADLPPGAHAITITYTDESGKIHTETKKFLVQGPTPIPTVAPQSLPQAGSAQNTFWLLVVAAASLILGFILL